MPEELFKLSPDRDLQCYFLMPSAIAAMSGASPSGFTLSGKWRQQFDWAVVEWNRDNVFEHPTLRYLPDGDLSGLTLTYVEQRSGCIPLESNLVPVVDWDNLRIWSDDSGSTPYKVSLASLATAIEGEYVPASATMTLVSSPGAGNRVGLAFLESHHFYTAGPQDSLEQIAQGIASDILSNPDFAATSTGNSVTVTWKTGPNYGALRGANGNRITVYGFAENGASCWQSRAATFGGGQFPSKYQVTIDFGALTTEEGKPIPTDKVRKLRWTWAADLQPAEFNQAEFSVSMSNWTVTGRNRQYFVAGPGSRRIEDTDSSINYVGSWTSESGNYSGSNIHVSTEPGDSLTITYAETAAHDLYLGTRLIASGASANISIDGQPFASLDLALNGEDSLIRASLGQIPAGTHTVLVSNTGTPGTALYFDFLEIAYPTPTLPDFVPQPQLALATDWDTYHSQSLPAERTAWLINKLGFLGRVNHYVGALWFYELFRPGTQYASLTLTIAAETYSGSPTVILDIAASQGGTVTQIKHLALPDDTPATVAEALAALINVGTNLVWASVSGNELTLTARSMGSLGNGIWVQADPSSDGYSITAASNVLSGGIDGTPYNLDTTDALNGTLIAAADYWRTDLTATPRINRAARDWHQAFFTALGGYGIDSVASFSTELMNGDPSAQTGIAQCYPDGSPVVLNTPAIQTNFSPASLTFWTQVYLDMAGLQAAAGMKPYLQSGEAQWWYFSGGNPSRLVGMPFYDLYTQQQFQTKYGSTMPVIPNNAVDPSQYPQECAFLPGLIGAYTAAIRSALKAKYPGCRYEVLYPTDTNNTALNRIINYPKDDWTPANIDCLKTESFTFTQGCNLDQSAYSIGVSASKGFPNSARSHLVGISSASTAWMKEVDLAQSQGLESVVLFALDQYCLIGYPPPPFGKTSLTRRQG
ncbi:MAG: hypothetical protein M3Y72_24315 [Acidobacteriota bacterium]|nr:hypothetical protein [Acidobacteriota bacterium]